MINNNTPKNKWLDLLAQKIAEVRLSEVGFRFVPGIFPVFKRVKNYIEAKALIIKNERKI